MSVIIFAQLAILFFVAFDPQVPFLPNGVGFTFMLAFALLPVVLYRLSRRQAGVILKQSLPLLIIFSVSFFYIIVRLLFNEGGNVEFALSFFKAFFVFISVLFFFVCFYKDGLNNEFLTRVTLVYVANAAFNFLAGTYPEYFDLFKVFRSDLVSDSVGANPYRNSFISGSGYFSIGTAYGLAALLVAYKIVKCSPVGFFSACAFALICAAGFVAARTAFFAIACAALFIFINRSFYLVYLGVVALFIVSLLLLLPPMEPYILWMGSFFTEFASSDSASYLLSQMYFWPGLEIVLGGAGVVNDGSFVYTDSGYMQDILFGGVGFLLVKLSFVLVFFVSFCRISVLYAILFCGSVLVFHAKGLFVYNNAQGMAVFYFAYFYFCSVRQASVRLDDFSIHKVT